MKHAFEFESLSARAAAAALALGACCLPAAAQEPGQNPFLPTPVSSEANSAEAEMRRLFAEVERRLRAIDLALSDAAAGEAPLATPQSSGIDQLLRNVQEQGRSAARDMERILELALQNGGKSSSGQGGSCPNPGGNTPGQSPLDGPRGTSAPETPPSEAGGNPDRPQPAPGEKPDQGGERSEDPGENRPAPARPADARGDARVPVVDSQDAWGDLPERYREVFRAEGGGNMPLQYRDWIDAYYRRMNKRP